MARDTRFDELSDPKKFNYLWAWCDRLSSALAKNSRQIQTIRERLDEVEKAVAKKER
jgi:hypothetical protein